MDGSTGTVMAVLAFAAFLIKECSMSPRISEAFCAIAWSLVGVTVLFCGLIPLAGFGTAEAGWIGALGPLSIVLIVVPVIVLRARAEARKNAAESEPLTEGVG